MEEEVKTKGLSVTKSVPLGYEEAKKVWDTCVKLGYKSWAPCLRHLIVKCVETKCWERGA